MKRAMEVRNAVENLRWVAYEEYVAYDHNDSDEDEVKRNDITESSETDEKTDDEVSELSSEHDDDNSESADFEEEG